MARRPGVSGAVFDEVERWTELGLGLAGLASGYTRSHLLSDEEQPGETREAVTLADFAAVLPGAAATISQAAQRVVFDLVTAIEERINEASEKVGGTQLTAGPIRALHAWLASLDEQFQADQSRRAEQAAEFLARVGPETTAELLSRVDMNMVLSEVDMDALVERITLERVLERVDVNSLMTDVLTELDTGNLLRESTGVIASSTVDSIRTLPGAAGRMAGRVVRRP